MPRKKSSTYTKSDCKRVLYLYAYKKIPVALYKTILACIDSYFEKKIIKSNEQNDANKIEESEVESEENKQLDLFIDFKI